VKKPRKKKVLAAIALLAVGAAIAFPFLPHKDFKKVYVARVEQVDELKSVVNGSGEIRTEESVDIQAEIAGVIIDLPVREGDHVKKDQVLLKIDPFQTDTDVQSARSALSALEAEAAGQLFQIATSQANVARDEFLKKSAEVEKRQAEANLARAGEAFKRDQRLLTEKLVSPDQFEVTETQFKVNEAQVEAASAHIEQLEAQIKATKLSIDYARSTRDATLQRVEGARSNLRRADDLLNRTTIRSPLNGVVVKLNVEKGERAVPGILSNPQATLMTIADLSIIEAELKIDETDIVNVKPDDVGRVDVDALPEVHLIGRVIEIGNSPIITSSMSQGAGGSQEGKDFKVVLRIEDPPASLRPGMSCEADITTKVRRDVTVVPIQALTLREVKVDAEGKYLPPPIDDKAGPGGAVAAGAPRERLKELQGVFIPGDGKRARFRPVKTGIIGEMDIEVLDGLAIGEEVVVGPLKALRTLEENSFIEVDRTKPFHRLTKKRGKTQEESEEEK
jgi:HlyD family secretion protein